MHIIAVHIQPASFNSKDSFAKRLLFMVSFLAQVPSTVLCPTLCQIWCVLGTHGASVSCCIYFIDTGSCDEILMLIKVSFSFYDLKIGKINIFTSFFRWSQTTIQASIKYITWQIDSSHKCLRKSLVKYFNPLFFSTKKVLCSTWSFCS